MFIIVCAVFAISIALISHASTSHANATSTDDATIAQLNSLGAPCPEGMVSCSSPVDIPDEMNPEVGLIKPEDETGENTSSPTTDAENSSCLPNQTDETAIPCSDELVPDENSDENADEETAVEPQPSPSPTSSTLLRPTPRTAEQSSFPTDWWLRSPGATCATYDACRVHYVTAAGSASINNAKNAHETAGVRPTLFISLASVYPATKSGLSIGKCPSATGTDANGATQLTSPSCIVFGDPVQYAFDIVGINTGTGDNVVGTCTLAVGDYGDLGDDPQCPTNSIQLLLSSESPTIPPPSRFCSGSSTNCNEGAQIATSGWAYSNISNPINTAMNTLYNTIKTLPISGTANDLQSSIIPRELFGTANCTAATEAKCSKAAPIPNANLFPMTGYEAHYIEIVNLTTIYPSGIGGGLGYAFKNQYGDVGVPSSYGVTANFNTDSVLMMVANGTGSGQYQANSRDTSICDMQRDGTSTNLFVVTPPQSLQANSTPGYFDCPIAVYREGDADYKVSQTNNGVFRVWKVVYFNNSGSGFDGSDAEHAESVFTNPPSGYPSTMYDSTAWYYRLGSYSWSAVKTPINPFTRTNYSFNGWCTQVDSTGNGTGTCFGQNVDICTMGDSCSSTGLYPKWVKSLGNPKEYSGKYWTRSSAGDSKAGIFNTDGTPTNEPVTNSNNVRPMMFIDLGKFMTLSGATQIQPGTCGSLSNSDPNQIDLHCIYFSHPIGNPVTSYETIKFDIVGVNSLYQGTGVCKYDNNMESYSDHNGAWSICPRNSIALIASDYSDTLSFFGTSAFNSNSANNNNYASSTIDTNLQTAYNTKNGGLKNYVLYGDGINHTPGPTLQNLIITRDIIGGVANTQVNAGTGKIAGTSASGEALFLPSSKEVSLFPNAETPETISTYTPIPDDCYFLARSTTTNTNPPAPNSLPSGVTCDRTSEYPNGILTIDTDTYPSADLYFRKRDDKINNLIGIAVKGNGSKSLKMHLDGPLNLNPSCSTSALNVNPTGSGILDVELDIASSNATWNNVYQGSNIQTVCENLPPTGNYTHIVYNSEHQRWHAATIHVPKKAKFTLKSTTGIFLSSVARGSFINTIGSNTDEFSWGEININSNMQITIAEGAGIGGGIGKIPTNMEGGVININSGRIYITGGSACSTNWIDGSSGCSTGPRAAGNPIGCGYSYSSYCSFGTININGGNLILTQTLGKGYGGYDSTAIGLGGCSRENTYLAICTGIPDNSSTLNIHGGIITASLPLIGPNNVLGTQINFGAVIGAPKMTPDGVKDKLTVVIDGGNVIAQNRFWSNPASQPVDNSGIHAEYEEKNYFASIDPQPQRAQACGQSRTCPVYPNIVPATLNKINWGKSLYIPDVNVPNTNGENSYVAKLLSKGDDGAQGLYGRPVVASWAAGVVWLPKDNAIQNMQIVNESDLQTTPIVSSFDTLKYSSKSTENEYSYDQIAFFENNLFVPDSGQKNCGLMVAGDNNPDSFANYTLPSGVSCTKDPGGGKSPTTTFSTDDNYFIIPTPTTPMIWENGDYRAVKVTGAGTKNLTVVDSVVLNSMPTSQGDDVATFLVDGASTLNLKVLTGKTLGIREDSPNIAENHQAFAALNGATVNISGDGAFKNAGTVKFITSHNSMTILQNSKVKIASGNVVTAPRHETDTTAVNSDPTSSLEITGGSTYLIGSKYICNPSSPGRIEISSGSLFAPRASSQEYCTAIKNKAGAQVYPTYATTSANDGYELVVPVGSGGLTTQYTAQTITAFADPITTISDYSASWTTAERAQFVPDSNIKAVIWLPGSATPGTRYDNIKINGQSKYLAEVLNSYSTYANASANKKNLVYEPTGIKFRYNANGSNTTQATGGAGYSPPSTDATCSYGTAFTPISPPATNGYTFKGWTDLTSAWTNYVGTSNQTINSQYATSTMTCYGASTGTTTNLYAVWHDDTAPVINSGDKLTATKDVSNGDLTFTVSSAGISDSASTAGQNLTWILSSAANGGGTTYCASQIYSTNKTCTANNVPNGTVTVYLTVKDTAGNQTSVSQQFKNANSSIDLTLQNNSGTSILTTDTGLEGTKITAKVTPDGTVATKPDGTVTFSLFAPSDTSFATDLASTILNSTSCTLANASASTDYFSSCDVTFKNDQSFGINGGAGNWTIKASYSGDSAKLVKASNATQTNSIQTTSTSVEFEQVASTVSTTSTNVNVTGKVICVTIIGTNDNCKPEVSGSNNLYYYTIHSNSANGYSDYTSSDLTLDNDGKFDFQIPQISISGNYSIKVFFKGNSVYKESSSSSLFSLEVLDSGIDSTTCIKNNVVIVVNPPDTCSSLGGTEITGEFKFSPAFTHSQITTSELTNTTIISLKAPDFMNDLADDGGDANKSKVFVQLYLRGNSTPVASVSQKLTNAACYPAPANCGTNVQNTYQLTFPQPTYLVPGTYYYTASFSGSSGISPIDIGHVTANEFTVVKTPLEMEISPISPFEFDNLEPAPTGVLAQIRVFVADDSGYGLLVNSSTKSECEGYGGVWNSSINKCYIDTTKNPNWITNGKLNYSISPDYDSTYILRSGILGISDTNCTPSDTDIQNGWRGCTTVDNVNNPLERKFYVYLGDYTYRGTFGLDVTFGKISGSEDDNYEDCEQLAAFDTTVSSSAVEIEYEVGANGEFVDPNLTNTPKEYFANGSKITLDKFGGSYSPPKVKPNPGYVFAGWYFVQTPAADDAPFSPQDYEMISDIKLYAVYVGPIPGHCSIPGIDNQYDCENHVPPGIWYPPEGHCSNPEFDNQVDCENGGGIWTPGGQYCTLPQYLTQEDCEDNGGVWYVTGAWLTADRYKVMQGDSLFISGYYFAPNQIVDIFLNSDPVLLGTVDSADENGMFTDFFVKIPRNTRPGVHTLSAFANSNWGGQNIAVPVELGVDILVTPLPEYGEGLDVGTLLPGEDGNNPDAIWGYCNMPAYNEWDCYARGAIWTPAPTNEQRCLLLGEKEFCVGSLALTGVRAPLFWMLLLMIALYLVCLSIVLAPRIIRVPFLRRLRHHLYPPPPPPLL